MKILAITLVITCYSLNGFGQRPEGRPAPPSMEERIEKATSKLDLSEEQATKWTEIMNFYEPEMKKAHEDRDRETLKTIRDDMNIELMATLNEEQKEQFSAMQEERENRMKSQKPQGRGNIRQR